MRGVAEAEQSGHVPAVEPVQPYVEMLDVVHRGDRVDPAGEAGSQFRDVPAELFDPWARSRASLPFRAM
ncbi:hypothetical protein GCM10027615_41120 [Plantactinospora veratri]